MSDTEPRLYRSRGPSLFWPILLIGAGVIFLLYNLGLLHTDPWPLLWRLWPIVLIVIGLDILLGRRSVLGGLFSAVFALLLIGAVVALLFAAQNYPALLDLGTPELQSERITHPLGEVRQASVEIDFPGGTGYLLGLDDSSNLIEADLHYYGTLADGFSVAGSQAEVRLSSRRRGFGWWDARQERWNVGLNPRVEYNLKLEAGSGDYEFDLRPFTLRSLGVELGSGQARLTLPEAGQYRCELNVGSGSLNLHVPEGVAVRVEYEVGSGALNAPGLTPLNREQHSGVYESAGFSQTGHYVIIRLDIGSGSVTIR